MGRGNFVLALLLSVSVTINLWLLYHYPFFSGSESSLPDPALADSSAQVTLNSQSVAIPTPPQLNQSFRPELLEDALQQDGNELKVKWLQQNRHWLEQGQYQQVKSFLQLYLKYYPQDIEFLILEADLISHTDLLSRALEHYYGLLELPLNEQQYQRIESTIHRLAFDTIEQLEKMESWDLLATFVEPLLQVDPTKREYILTLANAYAALLQGNLMESTLASLQYNDNAAMQVRQRYNRLKQQRRPPNEPVNEDHPFKQKTAIPLRQFGDQFVVPAILNTRRLNLLIDTGASISAISRQYFEQNNKKMNTRFMGLFSVNTASGQETAPMYQFEHLIIGQQRVSNITMVVLPMQGFDRADGLLGMNFLREFDFKLDQQQGLLYLLGL